MESKQELLADKIEEAPWITAGTCKKKKKKTKKRENPVKVM